MGTLRKQIFWMQDALKGKLIKKHFDEIGKMITQHQSKESILLRNKYLNNILVHAISTTDYYGNLNIKPGIEQFPVVNKSIIRDNFEAFRSETFRNKQIIKMTTSGSTGTPFTVYQDLNKKNRNYADTLFFAMLAGYDMGHQLYYLKIWSENNRISKLKARMQNMVPVDVIRLDDRMLADLVENLESSKRPKAFLGYASAFDNVVQYLNRKRSPALQGNIRSAIAISESLNPDTKTEMKRYFGVPVVSRYSNLENGILAQQCAHDDEFHINTASYHIEIFDLNKDNPVDPGTLGRIVVTDLFNYAMPLIRYDTGDVGILSNKFSCDFATPVLTRLEGRKLDLLYDSAGKLISSYLVYKNMWKYTEINQYQLVQEGKKEYRFKINIHGSFAREEELIKEFKSYLGDDAEFHIEYVSEIPLLASGKRKKIVNNYIKP